MRFRNLRVSRKLLILVAVLQVFMMAVSATAFWNFRSMAISIDDMYNNRVLSIKWLNEVSTHNRAIEADMLYMIQSDDQAELTSLQEDITARESAIQANMTSYQAISLDEKENELLDKHDAIVAAYVEAKTEIINDAMNGKKSEGYAKLKSSRSELDAINTIYQQLADYNAQLGEQLKQQIDDQKQKANLTIYIMLCLALVLGTGIAFVIVRTITNPLRDMKRLMHAAEQGDLTQQGTYRSNDEIGGVMTSFNNMIGGLRTVILHVQGTAEHVAASSGELTASAEETGESSERISVMIQELAAGNENQARAVKDITTTTQDISKRIEEIGISSKNAVVCSEQAAQRADQGMRNIKIAIRSMDDIDENVTSLNGVITGLRERSKQIGDIVRLITGIASQTNLLALNAAIEAARAGEEGKGFAVVAGEVRKLAEQTSVAAQQITELIQGIQAESEYAAASMSTTSDTVTAGSRMIQSLGATFDGIHTAIGEAVHSIEAVSTSLESAETGVLAVAHSMQAISRVAKNSAAVNHHVTMSTDEQLAAMHEVTDSAKRLTQLAQELQSLASRFQIGKQV